MHSKLPGLLRSLTIRNQRSSELPQLSSVAMHLWHALGCRGKHCHTNNNGKDAAKKAKSTSYDPGGATTVFAIIIMVVVIGDCARLDYWNCHGLCRWPWRTCHRGKVSRWWLRRYCYSRNGSGWMTLLWIMWTIVVNCRRVGNRKLRWDVIRRRRRAGSSQVDVRLCKSFWRRIFLVRDHRLFNTACAVHEGNLFPANNGSIVFGVIRLIDGTNVPAIVRIRSNRHDRLPNVILFLFLLAVWGGGDYKLRFWRSWLCRYHNGRQKQQRERLDDENGCNNICPLCSCSCRYDPYSSPALLTTATTTTHTLSFKLPVLLDSRIPSSNTSRLNPDHDLNRDCCCNDGRVDASFWQWVRSAENVATFVREDRQVGVSIRFRYMVTNAIQAIPSTSIVRSVATRASRSLALTVLDFEHTTTNWQLTGREKLGLCCIFGPETFNPGKIWKLCLAGRSIINIRDE